MTLADYQATYSWRAALELAPKITLLAEELPETEHNALGTALRTLALDLVAAVGEDLIDGSNLRQPVIVRLQSAIELINRVYPALDTVVVEQALTDRLDRFFGGNFTEAVPATPQVPLVAEEEPAEAPVPTAAPETPAVSSSVSPTVTPASTVEAPPIGAAPIGVPPAPSESPAPAPSAPDTSGTHITLTPSVTPATETPDVHPDSQQ